MLPHRIQQTFKRLAAEQRCALIPFVTSGFPTLEATVPLMHGLVAGGSDIIELGIPFSDPMADGPVIQRASEIALANGATLLSVLANVQQFRRQDQKTPIVLMGYANPIVAMGIETFINQAAQAGVDGVLLVDYPPEEYGAVKPLFDAAGIDIIFLLAPTSTAARIAEVAAMASGYVYYVSLAGVTGAQHIDTAAIAAKIPQLRQAIGLPVGVGFGIKDGKTAQQISKVADAVIIGSRIIEEISTLTPAQYGEHMRQYMQQFRQSMDQG